MLQHRLLDIATREFGAKGLEGASTRKIAAAAGTAMSSITYHYGGKDGLYLAVAAYVAERMREQMAPALELDQPLEDTPGGARAAIQRIIARIIDEMAGEEVATWSLFIMREQMAPTEGFERIYEGLIGQLLERLVALVCVASGQRDAAIARVVTITLMGQATAIRASRASCLKLLERDAIDAEAVESIKARIAVNTDAILDRLIAERQEPQ